MPPIRIALYTLTLIIMIFFLNLINQKINFPPSKITKYDFISLTETEASLAFHVDKPSIIYWRLVPADEVAFKAADLTNLSSINSDIKYGGGVIDDNAYSYTNLITPLTPNTMYSLYVIAVAKVGEFPKNVLKITFSTK